MLCGNVMCADRNLCPLLLFAQLVRVTTINVQLTAFHNPDTCLSSPPPQVPPGCRSEWPTGRAPAWAAPSSCPARWRATPRRSSCGPKTAATSTAAGPASGCCSTLFASRRWRPRTQGRTSARPPTASAASTSTTRSSLSVGARCRFHSLRVQFTRVHKKTFTK